MKEAYVITHADEMGINLGWSGESRDRYIWRHNDVIGDSRRLDTACSSLFLYKTSDLQTHGNRLVAWCWRPHAFTFPLVENRMSQRDLLPGLTGKTTDMGTLTEMEFYGTWSKNAII